MKSQNNSKGEKTFLINDEIKINNYENVRVLIDESNRVMKFSEAISLADKMSLDIILINENVRPQIVRIADYNKMLYDLKKSSKKVKQPKPMKEIDLSVNIASNDLETKARKAKEFIEDGSKVKVVLTMRGRELTRKEASKKCIFEFITMLEDVAVAESMPKDEGNRTTVILKKKNK